MYAIDAAEISLHIRDFPRALFRSTIGGIKMHTKYDINNSVPDYLFMTNAKEHENHTLSEMQLTVIHKPPPSCPSQQEFAL